MSLSGPAILYVVLSFVLAIASSVALVAVARARGSRLWLVPGWLAAAALAPVISTFFAVRLLIAAFQSMAFSGGGIASVSAAMWEATQPLIASSYLAAFLAICTLIVAVRAASDKTEEQRRPRFVPAVIATIAFLLTIGAVIGMRLLFFSVTSFILDVIVPQGPEHRSPAAGELSRVIASRLALTAEVAIAATLALIAAVMVMAVVSRRPSPSAGFSRILAAGALTVAVACVANGLAFQSEATRLHRIVMTGPAGAMTYSVVNSSGPRFAARTPATLAPR